MPVDDRDFKVALSGQTAESPKQSTPPRPWLSVWFNCCGVYQRVYRKAGTDRYAGRCPRCLRPVTFIVGPGGTNARQFVVE